jgi:hypothetical protein
MKQNGRREIMEEGKISELQNKEKTTNLLIYKKEKVK